MSKALTAWRGQRAMRLDRLAAAHVAMRTAATGVHSEYLNWSLLLAVASEFQGFARHLHDLAVAAFVAEASPANPALATVLHERLTIDRDLDKGNPQPPALGNDFGRLGLPLWSSLGTSSKAWKASLTMLLDARNGVAHADMVKLASVRKAGFGISGATIKRWRTDLDAMAGAMDEAVAAHHASLFRTKRPW